MTQLLLILVISISSVLAVTIEVGNFYYVPSDIVINAGETVQWENVQGTHDVDGTTNNITDELWNNPEDFYLGTTSTGDMGSITFTIPGVYNYNCGMGNHATNGMGGTITVNPASNQGCQNSADCEDESFCNMDYTYDYSNSSCESCVGFEEIDNCYTAGLPDAGEVECANTCFGDDDCTSGIYDCAGDCDGDAVVDDCGICDGEGVDLGSQGVCDCDGNIFDCSGECGGTDLTCMIMGGSDVGVYENADCSGDLSSLTDGMCMMVIDGNQDISFLDEAECIASGGIFLSTDACHGMNMNMLISDEDACSEIGGLWLETFDDYGNLEMVMCIEITVIDNIDNELDCENNDGYMVSFWLPNMADSMPLWYFYENGTFSLSSGEQCIWTDTFPTEYDCLTYGGDWDQDDDLGQECDIDDDGICLILGGNWFDGGLLEAGTWLYENDTFIIDPNALSGAPDQFVSANLVMDEDGNWLSLDLRFLDYIFSDEIECGQWRLVNIDSSLDNTDINMPSDISIDNIYPNPFNPVTTINFSVSQSNHININIYDLNGKFVKSINSKQYSVGNHSETINISDNTSGIYFVRLEFKNKFLTQKLILLK